MIERGIIPAASAIIGTKASNQPELVRDRINDAIMKATHEGFIFVSVLLNSSIVFGFILELRNLGYRVEGTYMGMSVTKIEISW